MHIEQRQRCNTLNLVAVNFSASAGSTTTPSVTWAGAVRDRSTARIPFAVVALCHSQSVYQGNAATPFKKNPTVRETSLRNLHLLVNCYNWLSMGPLV